MSEEVRFDVLDLMTSGPIALIVLESPHAAEKLTQLKGATNPQSAKENTLRHQFGSDIKWNAVHCSDDNVSAIREIALLFSHDEVRSCTSAFSL